MNQKLEKTRCLNIPMALMPRRSDESQNEFQRIFNDRVLDLFADNREKNVEIFKKDAENFLETLKADFIWGESGETKYVTLVKLQKILKKSPESIKSLLPYSTVNSFAKITNFNMAIDITLIEELIKTVTHAEKTYIALLPFSENSTEISTYSLKNFVSSQYIPLMVEEPESAEYYSAYAVSIIFFLLDARRREFVYLKDLLSSTLLMHLEACIHAENNCSELPEVDVFTVAQFRSTLYEFRCLDTDRNGVLSTSEMGFFRDGYFNAIFLQRAFDISLTYEGGCLDFKAFVDLTTAIRFRHTHASIKFHFEALDLKSDGILDEEEIRTAAQALPEYAPENNGLNADIVTAELMDMLRLNNGVTVENFIANRMSATFTGFLTNYADYLKYEGREQ